MSVFYMLFETSLGTCALSWKDERVVSMMLPAESKAIIEARLNTSGVLKHADPPKWALRAAKAVASQIEGRKQDFSRLVLDLESVPPFHRKVYEAARAIAPGKTETYGSLAKKIGSPSSSRAVGQALGANPFAIIVPCHRVLAAGNKLGGFSAVGGPEQKKKLLMREGASLAPPPPTKNSARDLAALAQLRAADPKLGKLIDRVGVYALTKHLPRSTFEALARSIVYQQLSGKAAATILARVIEAIGGELIPEAVTRASDKTLRAAGLSGSKAASLRDLAAKTIARKIPTISQLLKMDEEDVIATLTEVRGIGRWSVEMLLMFRLGRRDVLPVSDYGIRKGFQLTFGTKEMPSLDEVAKRGEKWRPHRTMASWYLWRSLDVAT